MLFMQRDRATIQMAKSPPRRFFKTLDQEGRPLLSYLLYMIVRTIKYYFCVIVPLPERLRCFAML
jgi:hypothetical protein